MVCVILCELNVSCVIIARYCVVYYDFSFCCFGIRCLSVLMSVCITVSQSVYYLSVCMSFKVFYITIYSSFFLHNLHPWCV